MGEYALYNGQEIKIGTCESMYYLRYEDRNKVKYSDSWDGCEFRLPFPDEDDVEPGGYEVFNRMDRLYLYKNPELATNPGIVQLTHESGLLVNVTCYHGEDVPANTAEAKFFWNGKASGFYGLLRVKPTKAGMRFVVGCRFCQKMWSCTLNEIADYIPDKELLRRLYGYLNQEGERNE